MGRTEMRIGAIAAAIGIALLMGCAWTSPIPDPAELEQQVMDTETAFARTMADRDHAGFAGFLSEEAIFFAGSKLLRGKQEIAEGWKPYYEQPKAPFSWKPQQVAVLDSGTLALSTGPVYDPEGNLIAHFTSIWRLEAPGVWRIVFDKGNEACK